MTDGDGDPAVRSAFVGLDTRLASADGPDQVRANLERLVEATMTASARQLRLFLEPSLVAVLRHVASTWLPALTAPERDSLVAPLFLFDPVRTVYALEEALKWPAKTTPSSVWKFCEQTLVDLLAKRPWMSMLEALAADAAGALSPTDVRQQADAFVGALHGLPQRLANRLNVAMDSALWPAKFNAELATAAVRELAQGRLSPSGVAATSSLCERLVVDGCAPAIASGLLSHAARLQEAQVADWLAGIAPARRETIIMSVLSLSPPRDFVSLLLTRAARADPQLRFLITHKVFAFGAPQSDANLASLADVVASLGTAREAFSRLLECWADRTFLRAASEEKAASMTAALALLLARLPRGTEAQLDDAMPVFSRALSMYLDHPLVSLRVGAMALFECFATHAQFSTERAIHFELDAADAAVARVRGLYRGERTADDAPAVEEELPPPAPADIIEEIDSDDDPDAPVDLCALDERSVAVRALSSAPISEADADADDGLVAYDIPTAAAPVSLRPPAYLSDAIAYLQAHEDADKTEAALASIERLVRNAHKGELTEQGPDLARRLLYLQDAFNLDGFTARRRAGLVALSVADSDIAKSLGEQFYERGLGLAQRMDLLDVFSLAVREISLGGLQSSAAEAVGGVETAARALDGKTLRRSRRLAAEAKQVAKRGGATTAPRFGVFFFPLLTEYGRPRATWDVVADEPLLVERLLKTLAIVADAASNAPVFTQMAQSILELWRILQRHPSVGVRRALLSAVSVVVVTLSTSNVPLLAMPAMQQEATLFSVGAAVAASEPQFSPMWPLLGEALPWLESLVESEADDEGRALALHAALALDDLIRKTMRMVQ